MTSIANGELGSTVRSKLNSSLAVTDAFTVSGANVGIGVTPSASTLPTVESLYGLFVGSTETNITANAYFGSSWKYVNTAAASKYTQYLGAHQWFNAPSGTAGNAITFTQAMTLDSSGILVVGATSPFTSTIKVQSLSGFASGGDNTGLRLLNTGATGGGTVYANTGSAGGITIGSDAGPLISMTAGTERMRIDSAGNVGIGTASPNAASILDAQSTTKGVRFPNMTTVQKAAMANVAGNVVFDTTLGKLCVNSGSGWQTITSV